MAVAGGRVVQLVPDCFVFLDMTRLLAKVRSGAYSVGGQGEAGLDRRIALRRHARV